jgi:hypothetical protein
MNARNGFPVFSTHIEANYVSKATFTSSQTRTGRRS